MKIAATLFLLLLSGILLAKNADSLAIKTLTDKVILLENKVDILNNTNDKLLTVTWSVIGIVAGFFAVVIGLNFWNNFSINRQKINNIKEELKTHLEGEQTDKIKRAINSELFGIKSSLKLTERQIDELDIYLVKDELNLFVWRYGNNKLDKLIKFLKLSMKVESYYNMQSNTIDVEDSLNLILEYIKEKAITIEEKKQLLETFEKLKDGYKFHIDEIVKNIKIELSF